MTSSLTSSCTSSLLSSFNGLKISHQPRITICPRSSRRPSTLLVQVNSSGTNTHTWVFFSVPEVFMVLWGQARTVEAGVGMFGTKCGMRTFFNKEGLAYPCTIIGFEEGNMVAQVKTDEQDGYSSVQVGSFLLTVIVASPTILKPTLHRSIFLVQSSVCVGYR